MCFCLYLATSSEPPLIPSQGFQEVTGKINTSRRRLEESSRGKELRSKFTLPYLTDVGSDVGCGCGFRHNEGEAYVPGYDSSKTQPNHAGLVAFLAQHCGKEPFVELYGCWDGDEGQDARDRREIGLAEFANERFHFRMNGYCRVYMPGNLPIEPTVTKSGPNRLRRRQ
jgi:hypothetical protein